MRLSEWEDGGPTSGSGPEHQAQSRGPLRLSRLHFVRSPAGKKEKESSKDSDWGIWGTLTYMAVGGGGSGGPRAPAGWGGALPDARSPPPLPPGLAVSALPLLGFTGAGIAANSVAASLMSWSAVLNGGAVPAGGLVATLQSLGECGPLAETFFTVLSPFHRLTRLRGVDILLIFITHGETEAPRN